MHRQEKQSGTVVWCGLWNQLPKLESLISHLLAMQSHFTHCSSSMSTIITCSSLFYYEDQMNMQIHLIIYLLNIIDYILIQYICMSIYCI